MPFLAVFTISFHLYVFSGYGMEALVSIFVKSSNQQSRIGSLKLQLPGIHMKDLCQRMVCTNLQ